MFSSRSDSAFLNQLAWRVAAGIAAAAALVAVILTTRGPVRRSAAWSVPSSLTATSRTAPELQESPVGSRVLPLGGDVDRCIEFCASHVTAERSFVIFSRGTCVIVDEPSGDPIVNALETLEAGSSPNARFITRQVEAGHYLVTYRHPVFHCLFSDEIATHRHQVEREFVQYLTPAERRSMSPGFDPPFHAKLGLLARFRLNRDAADPVVSKVIRANSSPSQPEPAGPPEPGTAASRSDPTHLPRVDPPFRVGY